MAETEGEGSYVVLTDVDWTLIPPIEVTGTILAWEAGPLNENGERCVWPWEPQQLSGLGQYHCSVCGGMQLAGMPHLDWSDDEETTAYEGWVIARLLGRWWACWLGWRETE